MTARGFSAASPSGHDLLGAVAQRRGERSHSIKTAHDLTPLRVLADFNGLFGNLLCISHSEMVRADSGDAALEEGMELIAYEPDAEGGVDCFLVARGRVLASPPDLECLGSRWVLEVDRLGVRHVEQLKDA